jgi:diguanylate cyclase (GGDEF)-like protein
MAVLGLSALFGAAIAVSLAVGAIAWRRRHEAVGFVTIGLIAAGAAWWSAMSLVPLLTQNPQAVWISLAAAYPGVFLLVVGWWATARTLADRFWTLSRRTGLALLCEPLLCGVALLTNPWHHLFIVRLQPTDLDGALAAVFGPLFWLHAIYCYALVLYSAVTIFRTFIRATHRYRGYLLAVLSAAPSATINVVAAGSGGRLIDLTAVGFAVGAPVMYWVVKSQSVTAVAPVAHHKLFQTMDDLVIVLDPHGRIIDHNPAAAEVLIQMPAADPSTPRGTAVPAELADLVVRGPGDYVVTGTGRSGIDLSIRITALHDRRGNPAGLVMVARDITEQNRQRQAVEQANERLRQQLVTIEGLRETLVDQASRDYLTGLYNRRHLMTELSRIAASGEHFAVALLDIDFFKQINDRYGHKAGDDVLIRVAGLLQAATYPGELAARYGGEEFALLLRETSSRDAARRIDVLRHLIETSPMRAADADITVTFSAGVALSTQVTGHLDALVHEADQALYTAKANGRNRVEISVNAPNAADLHQEDRSRPR